MTLTAKRVADEVVRSQPCVDECLAVVVAHEEFFTHLASGRFERVRH